MKHMSKDSLHRLIIMSVIITFLISTCIFILVPFFPAILLAIIFTLSGWPAFVWLEKRLNHRRTLTALVFTFFLALCFLFPLIFLGTSLAENMSTLSTKIVTTLQNNPTNAPQWIHDIPIVGDDAAQFWTEHADDKKYLISVIQKYSSPLTQWLIGFTSVISHGLLDITLGIIISFFFLRHRNFAANKLQNLVTRLAGTKGKQLLHMTKNTLIGVVYGILATALAQGVLAGLGFWMADVPGAASLGLITFFLSFIPFGAPLVWLPTAVWLLSEGNVFWGVFMLIWGTFVVSLSDNLIRPYFISLETHLPLLLVLLGVFGGIIAFGFIGIFIGPTILAVTYTLVSEWGMNEKPKWEKVKRKR